MEEIVFKLFEQWNKTLLKTPKHVAQNYAKDATLLGTINGKFRHGRLEIEDYFKIFCPLAPEGRIDDYQVFGDKKEIVFCGHYSFLVNHVERIHARFTFIYEKQKNGEYLIKHHHSSRIPKD